MSTKITTTLTPIASSIPAEKQRSLSCSHFDALPDSALIRQSQLVQCPSRPDSTAPLPFSAPTLWRKVADGSFPKPQKLSKRVTAWRVKDIRDWLLTRSAECYLPAPPRKRIKSTALATQGEAA